tara:strand:+ start:2381 stop:2638 length:258 start_codon:yes stop_codon:yes gene_type:complete
MNWKSSQDIPSQESREKWFKSHLLDREIELKELYEMPQNELDLIMAETAELRSDVGNRDRNLGKFCTAGYFLELARIIDKRRMTE